MKYELITRSGTIFTSNCNCIAFLKDIKFVFKIRFADYISIDRKFKDQVILQRYKLQFTSDGNEMRICSKYLYSYMLDNKSNIFSSAASFYPSSS